MACDTCQDCDNITLPVATGATGEKGSTGPAGADGADGTTVLHNDTTNSSTTSATKAVFSADKSYTMPAGTLATNGSKLKITALFYTSGGADKSESVAYIEIGGTEVLPTSGSYTPYTLANYSQDMLLKVELTVTRTSTTNLFIEGQTLLSENGRAAQVLKAFQFMDTTLAVADIDANTLLIQAKGKTATTTSFNCAQLTIDHLVK